MTNKGVEVWHFHIFLTYRGQTIPIFQRPKRGSKLPHITDRRKLRSYAVFKRDFFLEKYLLHESLVNRKNLTRLRISSHKLSVETGRFNKTPLENRLCAMCDKGLVEDEFHFMISCTAYEKPRDHLFKYLSGFTDIQNFPDNEIFSVLMSCNNGDYEFT